MTSSQLGWPGCTTPLHQQHATEERHSDVGSIPQHFRSRDLIASKMASFGRRMREAESVGGDGELVSMACCAYYRWSTAVEIDRRTARVHGQSNEHLYDKVHAWIIDILDTALHRSTVSACDFVCGLSLAALNRTFISNVSMLDIQTLLQRLTNSLCTSQYQVSSE